MMEDVFFGLPQLRVISLDSTCFLRTRNPLSLSLFICLSVCLFLGAAEASPPPTHEKRGRRAEKSQLRKRMEDERQDKTRRMEYVHGHTQSTPTTTNEGGSDGSDKDSTDGFLTNT